MNAAITSKAALAKVAQFATPRACAVCRYKQGEICLRPTRARAGEWPWNSNYISNERSVGPVACRIRGVCGIEGRYFVSKSPWEIARLEQAGGGS